MVVRLLDLEFLLANRAAEVLTQLAQDDISEKNTLSLLDRLRREFSAEQAGALLAMARLREKARDKFGSAAARMFFTAEALEQASDPLVRDYRSQSASRLEVVDMCCGIGSDALAFAAAGARVSGFDLDPLRIAIARHNAAALGFDVRFVSADIRQLDPSADTIFYDPARRESDGRRIYDVERYQPPLSLIRRWQARQIMAKLSPGVDLQQLSTYQGVLEFISVKGDLKEALLRLDGTAGSLNRRAVLLSEHETLFWNAVPVPMQAPLADPRGWLVEPDPALMRAGLVQNVALAFDGSMLDEQIAYFTTDTPPDSAWVRTWQILDWLPFHIKHLRAYLRQRGVGSVTVKKRGSPLTPETLVPQLKLKGDEARTLVLTHLRGKPIVLICQPTKHWFYV